MRRGERRPRDGPRPHGLSHAPSASAPAGRRLHLQGHSSMAPSKKMHVRTRTHVFTRTHAHKYTYAHAHVRTHVHTHTCTHTAADDGTGGPGPFCRGFHSWTRGLGWAQGTSSILRNVLRAFESLFPVPSQQRPRAREESRPNAPASHGHLSFLRVLRATCSVSRPLVRTQPESLEAVASGCQAP